MKNRKIINNGAVFDGVNLYDQGAVLFENGKILEIYKKDKSFADIPVIDARGNLIMPGIVDLHSDSLERSIEKRKNVFFDIGFAILNIDRHLACCGITSFCHAISFADNELGLRSPNQAEKCVEKIEEFNKTCQSLVKHNIHIRYEIGSKQSLKILMRLIDKGLVDILSIMDHTPGQGQFKSMESYVKFHADEYAISEQEILKKAEKKLKKNEHAWHMVNKLTKAVSNAEIPLLSHDDDTKGKINLIKKLGVGASEFPVTMEAAMAASNIGIDVFMGAPNLIRNQSTNGNLKASKVIEQDLCTGLVSDYYPESLIQACFMASEFTKDIGTALGKVTSGPGNFLNQPGIPGQLVQGSDADIIIVNRQNSWAHVSHTIVRGNTVFQCRS